MFKKFIKREANVFSDLAQQDWGNIPALVKRNSCATTRTIAELFMRSSLADFGETKFDQNGDNFTGLKDWNVAHKSSDCDVLNPDKLGFHDWLTIFK